MSTESKGYGGKDGPPPLTVRKPLVDLDRTWAEQAECGKEEWVDVEWFMPMGDLEAVEKARTVCRRCPVFVDCLEYAVGNDIQFGVWGGMTPGEREKYRG